MRAQARVRRVSASRRLRRRDGRRQRQPVGGRLDRGVEEVVLLVDVADRPDDGKDRRRTAEPRDHRLTEGAHGAPGGQQHRHAGERQRIARIEGKQPAGEQRLGQCGEERRTGGN